jgi:hypothetical protein
MQIARHPGLTLRDLAPPSDLERSPGLHVTQITGHILKEMYPRRYGKDMAAADSENYQETGFLWEDILSRTFADRASRIPDGLVRFRPDELVKDGIAGSPDAIVVDPRNDRTWVEEYKATWKSARDLDYPTPGAGLLDEKFLGYILQGKSYCYLADVQELHFYILFVNGEYGNRMVPEVRAYRLLFSQQELVEHWQMLCNTARKEGWM